MFGSIMRLGGVGSRRFYFCFDIIVIILLFILLSYYFILFFIELSMKSCGIVSGIMCFITGIVRLGMGMPHFMTTDTTTSRNVEK